MKLKSVAEANARPIQTYYYDTRLFAVDEWARIARAGSDVGALRGAVVRVMTGQYQAADVYGPDGVRRYQVRMERGNLVVHGRIKALKEAA